MWLILRKTDPKWRTKGNLGKSITNLLNKVLHVVCIILLTGFLSSCSQPGDGPGDGPGDDLGDANETSQPNSQQRAREKPPVDFFSLDAIRQKTFTYCAQNAPDSFNPQIDTSKSTADMVAHQIYDRLVYYDNDTNQLVPGLAASWQVSADGLVYRFRLKPGIQFHATSYFSPSRPLNAEDVVFSFNRWRRSDHPYYPINGGQYPYFDSLQLHATLAQVTANSEHEVTMRLVRPDSSFLATLATDYAVILSSEYANQLWNQGQPERIDYQPIGTGPFKFQQYQKNDYLRLIRHDAYHTQIDSQIEQVIFDITPNNAMRMAKLMTAECDAIAVPSRSDIQLLNEQSQFTLVGEPGLNVSFLAFNTGKAPFDNLYLRQAVSHAIDVTAIINSVYFGYATPARTLLSPINWSYNPSAKYRTYNPGLARELIERAGYPNGLDITLYALPVVRAYNPDATKMAKIIQSNLHDVGINVSIERPEWGRFKDDLATGKHDAVLIGWLADNGDPDNFYRSLLSCDGISGRTNRTFWCHAKYDQVIYDALKRQDVASRAAMYREADDLIYQHMPLFPIAHAHQFKAARTDIMNYQMNPFGGLRLESVDKRQQTAAAIDVEANE